ncbi:methylated-DNA--cysteine S-met [Xylariaceae sp. FL0016]|nr:methylated-DNA--cysteine S-met [Xylariaceae sp. FL0016]
MSARMDHKRKRSAKETALESAPRKVIKSDDERANTTVSPCKSVGIEAQLQRIAASDRTPFEKRVWSLLCQIPPGSVSTYGLISAHLGSSPRAVGNALRRNPFAPEVPCHRVVATGGTLGGFKGKWPKDGEGITIVEKRSLLRKEGVRFDEKGRVLGTPWAAFAM